MCPKNGSSLDLDPDPMDLMDLDLDLDPIHPSLTLAKPVATRPMAVRTLGAVSKMALVWWTSNNR